MNIAPDEKDKFGYRISKQNAAAAGQSGDWDKIFLLFFFHFFSAKLIFLFLPLVTLVSFYFPKNVFSIVEILNKLNKNDKSNFMDNSYDNDN